MASTSLVREAASRFMERDHDRCVACFHESVRVYGEPELSSTPMLSGRAELAQWLARHTDASVDLLEVSEHGEGVVTDAVIVGEGEMQEAWRLALAVRIAGDLITEVRAFRDRNAAQEALVTFR